MNEMVLLYFILIVFILSGCDNHDSTTFQYDLPEIVDFNFHIKPILSDRCFSCHGPDVNARKGDIRLDEEESVFKMLDSLERSYLIKPGDLLIIN